MELFRLRVQLSTITMHRLWQRSSASATEGSDVVFDFTLNPSAVDTSYTLFLVRGLDYTTTDVIVTFLLEQLLER
jgi:hypothetical protein